MRKKVLAALLSGVIVVSTIVTALPVSAVNSTFSDIQGHWSKDKVMELVGMGAISGYEDGTFRPDNNITYAEYLAILVRTTKAGNGDYSADDGEAWYNGVLRAARESGILVSNDVRNFDAPINRADAAKFTERAVQKVLGEKEINTTNINRLINDYSSFSGTISENYILQQYAKGIIQGDDNGNFNPNKSLTRAEASTIILNTVKPENRRDMSSIEILSENIFENLSEPITIYEGAIRENSRIAREGDIVVKADGTQVVLRKGVHGIVGEGQGVSPDLGYKVSGVGNTTVVATNVDKLVFSGNTTEVDSTGHRINNQPYQVNRITNEGHWGSEWQAMTSMPTTPGEFKDQLSADKNWIWDEVMQSWTTVYTQSMPDSVLNRVLTANGLN